LEERFSSPTHHWQAYLQIPVFLTDRDLQVRLPMKGGRESGIGGKRRICLPRAALALSASA